MNRRAHFLLGCLFIALSFLCPGALQADPVEVTLMLAPADTARPTWQKVSDEFNRTHSEVKFHILWTDIRPKLNLLVVAGALPDLLIIADHQLISLQDQLLDVGGLVDGLPDGGKGQYFPALLKSCEYEGTLKLVPITYNLPYIYYRPDLFRKAGLPEPTAGWTWDDYRRDAKALTERNADGSVKIWGTNVAAIWWVEWLGLIRQAGGEMLTQDGKVEINSPGTTKAMQLMHDLIFVDKSAPVPRNTPPNGFESGQVAIYYGGHVLELARLRQQSKFDWDIAPLPAGPAGQATGDLAVSGIGITAQSKHPEAAREVLRYLMSREVAMEFALGGLSPPVRQDIAQATILAGTPETRTVGPRHAEVLVDSLAFARPVPKRKDFEMVWPAINDLVNHALVDPDDSRLKDLPAQMETAAQVQMDLLKTRPSVKLTWFIAQVVVLGVIGLWLLVRFFQRTAMTPEEKAGQKYFFLFTAPCLLGLALFTVWPLMLSFWWAQTDYNMIDDPHYVGMAQYQALLFKDPEFWHSLKLSLLYAVIAVPLGLAISLGTALLLNLNLRHIGIFRVLFYMPSILPVAASSMMWVWLMNPQYGVINQALHALGLPMPGWITDPNWALPSLVIISLWGFGGAMLIFLAGLKNIPDSLYEAAMIDGAGTLSQFRHVTLPSLSPVMFFNLTMGCIAALQVFDVAYIISTADGGDDQAGGPEKSTNFYVLYLYLRSFTKLQMGTGSAMAWLFFVIILLITAVNFWAKRFWLAPEDERA